MKLFLITLLLSISVQARPNIILILADDLGYGDLSFNNSESPIDTPNLNRLAKEGIIFTAAYSSSAMCSPARAGLLTGRTPTRLGIHNWIKDRHKKPFSDVHLKQDEITIANLLKDAGYQTAIFGKWHLNNAFRSGNNSDPDHHGFDYWLTTAIHSYPSHKNPNNFFENGEKKGVMKGFASEIVADNAITWLNNRDKTKPFFLYLPFQEPHVVCDAPEKLKMKYMDRLKSKQIPIRKGFGKDGLGQAKYYACVENMDQHIGKIVQYLKEQNIDKETLIIFTSDNGPDTNRAYKGRNQAAGSAGDFKGRKRWLLEGGIRMPTFMWMPGKLPAGKVISNEISHLDFLPTISDLCEAKLPSKKLDGESILPILNRKKWQRTKSLHWHLYCSVSGPNSVLRKGKWVLTAEWTGEKAGGRFDPIKHGKFIKESKLKNFNLYNIENDPGQNKDLKNSFPELFITLKKELSELHREVTSESPLWPAGLAKEN